MSSRMMADDFLQVCLAVLICLCVQFRCTHSGPAGWSEFIGAVGSVFGAAEECRYTCANGATPQQDPNSRLNSNGCGSYGVTFSFSRWPEMTDCCDSHDHCYDTCGSAKAQCDRALRTCLEKTCADIKPRVSKSNYDSCYSTSQVMFTGTSALGCSAFLGSQKHVCVCEHSSHTRRKPRRRPPSSDRDL